MRHNLGRHTLAALALWLMAGQAQACTARLLSPAAMAEQLSLHDGEQITQAWTCKDASGEQLLVAARRRASEALHGTHIQFYKLNKTKDGWKKVWQARDLRPDGRTQPVASFADDILLLKDVNGDGLAEAYIAYALPGRGGEPDTGKLLVFYKDQKYTVRGAIARTAEDFGSRKTSANFNTLPTAVQAQALQLWDRLSMPGAHNKHADVLLTKSSTAPTRQANSR